LAVRRLLSYLLPEGTDVRETALLGRVIYLAFFLGVFVFAYKAYADHVTNSYFSIKNKILVMFEKSNRREMPDPADSPSQPPVAEQAAK
jgi:hypothetical protein